jgi:UDP-N-acetylglucosamine acyltransferase
VISPKAQIDPTANIGPGAVIDGEVTVGAGCEVGPHVYLTGWTRIGANNRFHAGCVIGDAPQDLKYKNERTGVIIGDDNVFREGVTVHRSAKVDEATVIGSHNYLMVNAHIGHNGAVGNHVIIANGALLAGHVEVGDRAFISGNCLIHQFTRIGTLAMMQGGAGVGRDLPPFTIAYGVNNIIGLNVVGLRRAGIKPEERLELKRLYQALFRSGRNLTEAAAAAQAQFNGAASRTMLDFVGSTKRGICLHRARRGQSHDDID